jgi:tetratricopeptide (TPR) repeat protein
MFIKDALRQLILWFLAAWREITHKQIAARTGRTHGQISQILSRQRETPLEEAVFQELLPAVKARPAHAAITAAWIESLLSVDAEERLMPGERDALELWLLGDTRKRRQAAVELVLRSREAPPLDEYPRPEHVEPARWRAGLQLVILRGLTDEERLAAVQSIRKFQSWSLAEAVADEATRCASKDLDKADAWARLAVEIAERVKGPEGWQKRIRGYAVAAGPNVLRVRGKLEEAEAGLEGANRLWLAGSDPDGILDPGRLLDFEGSLRRAQRRFDEALDRLARARQVSHHPGRVLIKRAFTLEVMGEYEAAVETLREAETLLGPRDEPRLWNTLDFNLAVNYSHLGMFREATELVARARPRATQLRDELDLIRFDWLDGRIEAGLGRTRKARSLLESALEGFRERKLWYDVALAFLELAALLLREGKRAEVRALTPILADVFKSRKVYVEALKALRCFLDAAESDAADEETARRVLRFLFRARHDKGLRFES